MVNSLGRIQGHTAKNFVLFFVFPISLLWRGSGRAATTRQNRRMTGGVRLFAGGCMTAADG